MPSKRLNCFDTKQLFLASAPNRYNVPIAQPAMNRALFRKSLLEGCLQSDLNVKECKGKMALLLQ
jgi:hypothetical protein